MSEERVMKVGVDKIDASNAFTCWNKFQCIMLTDIVITGYGRFEDGTFKVVDFTKLGKPYLPPEDCFWFVDTEVEAQRGCLQILKSVIAQINQGSN